MDYVVASAPGHVTLLGEHTDIALSLPLSQRTHAQLHAREDALVRVWSRELDASDDYELDREKQRGSWIDHVMGCTWAMTREGHALRGFELRITSDVPIGVGLSSGVALEIACLRALREAFALPLDDTELALLGQRARALVGAPVGVMDHLCASLGIPGSALFVDSRSLEATPIPVAAELDVLVIASGLHLVRDGVVRETRAREAEMDRVLAAVAALRAKDLELLGRLLLMSHAALRDDLGVSAPALDKLVEIAMAERDVLGARLAGRGSIVAIARAGTGHARARRIAERYNVETGNTPRILVAEPAS